MERNHFKHIAENNFDQFLAALNSGKNEEWLWLVAHFRERVVPWIRKNDGRLPANAIIAEGYFVEEVFAESLIKFYELFKTGSFKSLADLRGLIFKIANLKLKEGYRKFKKDQMVFFPELFEKASQNLEEEDFSEEIQEQQILVREMEKELENLPKEDREILSRFSKGEKLKDISRDLGIKQENGRKKKQRALKQMRAKLLKKFKL